MVESQTWRRRAWRRTVDDVFIESSDTQPASASGISVEILSHQWIASKEDEVKGVLCCAVVSRRTRFLSHGISECGARGGGSGPHKSRFGRRRILHRRIESASVPRLRIRNLNSRRFQLFHLSGVDVDLDAPINWARMPSCPKQHRTKVMYE